jgi:hypothetical protein
LKPKKNGKKYLLITSPDIKKEKWKKVEPIKNLAMNHPLTLLMRKLPKERLKKRGKIDLAN